MRVRAWSFELINGSVANRVDLAPGETRVVELAAGAGVPYKPTRFPTNYVYSVSLGAREGFVPFLDDTTNTDSRYLSAMVRLTPIYANP